MAIRKFNFISDPRSISAGVGRLGLRVGGTHTCRAGVAGMPGRGLGLWLGGVAGAGASLAWGPQATPHEHSTEEQRPFPWGQARSQHTPSGLWFPRDTGVLLRPVFRLP